VIEKKVDDDETTIYRLLEEHTKGAVDRHLYKGGKAKLGKEVPLSAVDEFANYPAHEDTGLDRPTLIPWENVPGGESDLFGLGPIFDSINEAESLMLDRGRKAIPRTFVDRSLADDRGQLKIDGYILTGGARMALPLGQSPLQTIETVQPHLYSQEHVYWIDHLTQLLVTCAGYSPLTWGLQGQTANVTRAVSGYAMKLSQLRTLLTRSAKEHMAIQALGWAFATALALQEGGYNVADYRPSIQLGDGLPDDGLDGAQEALWLRQGAAASTETLVKTIHKTWTPEEVEAEVEAIMQEGMFPPGSGQAQGIGHLPKSIQDLLAGAPDLAADGEDTGNVGVTNL